MGRPPRLIVPHGFYHIYNRGNGRKTLFFSPEFYHYFLTLLDITSEKFSIEIHAYCLMKNHYHLLVRLSEENLPEAMQFLFQSYSKFANKKLNSEGPLYKSRYQSRYIQTESDLLQITRYIHLNPVEADICSHPSHFEWSSFNSYCNPNNPNLKKSFLNTTLILSYFHCPKEYIEYTERGIDKDTYTYYKNKRKAAIAMSKSTQDVHYTML